MIFILLIPCNHFVLWGFSGEIPEGENDLIQTNCELYLYTCFREDNLKGRWNPEVYKLGETSSRHGAVALRPSVSVIPTILIDGKECLRVIPGRNHNL
jgi:hypothetical protein